MAPGRPMRRAALEVGGRVRDNLKEFQKALRPYRVRTQPSRFEVSRREASVFIPRGESEVPIEKERASRISRSELASLRLRRAAASNSRRQRNGLAAIPDVQSRTPERGQTPADDEQHDGDDHPGDIQASNRPEPEPRVAAPPALGVQPNDRDQNEQPEWRDDAMNFDFDAEDRSMGLASPGSTPSRSSSLSAPSPVRSQSVSSRAMSSIESDHIPDEVFSDFLLNLLIQPDQDEFVETVREKLISIRKLIIQFSWAASFTVMGQYEDLLVLRVKQQNVELFKIFLPPSVIERIEVEHGPGQILAICRQMDPRNIFSVSLYVAVYSWILEHILQKPQASKSGDAKEPNNKGLSDNPRQAEGQSLRGVSGPSNNADEFDMVKLVSTLTGVVHRWNYMAELAPDKEQNSSRLQEIIEHAIELRQFLKPKLMELVRLPVIFPDLSCVEIALPLQGVWTADVRDSDKDEEVMDGDEVVLCLSDKLIVRSMMNEKLTNEVCGAVALTAARLSDNA